MKKGKDYYTNPFILYFFLFFPDWEKDFRSDSTFLPNNQVPLRALKLHHERRQQDVHLDSMRSRCLYT